MSDAKLNSLSTSSPLVMDEEKISNDSVPTAQQRANEIQKQIELKKLEFSKLDQVPAYSGFIGLQLLSNVGSYFSVMEGHGIELIKGIKLGGADPLSVGGIMNLRSQSLTGDRKTDIATYLSNIISYKKSVPEYMLDFGVYEQPKVTTYSSSIYMADSFPAMMKQNGINPIEGYPTLAFVAGSVELIIKSTAETLSIPVTILDMYQEDREVATALMPTFQPTIKITKPARQVKDAIINLARIALVAMVKSQDEGKQFYAAYLKMKEAYEDIKQHTMQTYFGNTGYVTHLARIRVIKEINDIVKTTKTVFYTGRLADMKTIDYKTNIKRAAAVIGDRTDKPDLKTHKWLTRHFPLVIRRYWQFRQNAIAMNMDYQSENYFNTKRLQMVKGEKALVKVNMGSMAGPQYGQSIKCDSTIHQDAYLCIWMHRSMELLSKDETRPDVRENILQSLAPATMCYSKPKKEAKKVTAATNRFFNVYTRGWNIANHTYFNAVYESSPPYKFHKDSTSIYKLSLAGGEFSNLVNYGRYSAVFHRPRFLNYSDNIWFYRSLLDTKTNKMKSMLYSADMVKAEAQSLRATVRNEIRRSISILNDLDDGVDQIWQYHMLNFYPVQSIDSIGIIGKNYYLNAGLGSGQAGTVICNHINTVAFGAVTNHVDVIMAETIDGKTTLKWSPEMEKIAKATGLHLEITAFCEVQPREGSIVSTDILGMDAIFYNNHGVTGYFPILNEEKMKNAMLYHEGLEEKLKKIPHIKEKENELKYAEKLQFARAYYLREKFKAIYLLGAALHDRWAPIVSFMISAMNADLDKTIEEFKETELDVTGFLVETLSAFISTDSPIYATLSTIEHAPYLCLEDYFRIMGKQAGYGFFESKEDTEFHRVSYGDLYDYFTKFRDPMLHHYDFNWDVLESINEEGKPIEGEIGNTQISIMEGQVIAPHTVIGKKTLSDGREVNIMCYCHARISFIKAKQDRGACIEFTPMKVTYDNMTNTKMMKLYIGEVGIAPYRVQVRRMESDVELFRKAVLDLSPVEQRLLLSQATFTKIINIIPADENVKQYIAYPTQDFYQMVDMDEEQYSLWYEVMKVPALAEFMIKDPEFNMFTIQEIITLLTEGKIEYKGTDHRKTTMDLKEKYGEEYFDVIKQRYGAKFDFKITGLYRRRIMQKIKPVIDAKEVIPVKTEEEVLIESEPIYARVKGTQGMIRLNPNIFSALTKAQYKKQRNKMPAITSITDELIMEYADNVQPGTYHLTVPSNLSAFVGLGTGKIFNPSRFIKFLAPHISVDTGIPLNIIVYDLKNKCEIPFNVLLQWDATNKNGKTNKFEVSFNNDGWYALRKSVTANPANRNAMTEKVDQDALQNVPQILRLHGYEPFAQIDVAQYRETRNKMLKKEDREIMRDFDQALNKEFSLKAYRAKKQEDEEKNDKEQRVAQLMRTVRFNTVAAIKEIPEQPRSWQDDEDDDEFFSKEPFADQPEAPPSDTKQAEGKAEIKTSTKPLKSALKKTSPVLTIKETAKNIVSAVTQKQQQQKTKEAQSNMEKVIIAPKASGAKVGGLLNLEKKSLAQPLKPVADVRQSKSVYEKKELKDNKEEKDGKELSAPKKISAHDKQQKHIVHDVIRPSKTDKFGFVKPPSDDTHFFEPSVTGRDKRSMAAYFSRTSPEEIPDID